jgi:hypothetical protein
LVDVDVVAGRAAAPVLSGGIEVYGAEPELGGVHDLVVAGEEIGVRADDVRVSRMFERVVRASETRVRIAVNEANPARFAKLRSTPVCDRGAGI